MIFRSKAGLGIVGVPALGPIRFDIVEHPPTEVTLVFAPLRRLFRREDPADTVGDEVVDIIRRYQGLNKGERKAVISAFGFAKARVEIEYGEIDTWTLEHKVKVAKAVLNAAKDGYANVPHSSCGIALMGLYLEAKTIPGDKADGLVHLIEEWHRRAVRSSSS